MTSPSGTTVDPSRQGLPATGLPARPALPDPHPGAAGTVDLLLPLDGEEPEKPIEKLSASRLLGFAATDQLGSSVDLDVTIAMPGPAPTRENQFLGLVNVRPKDEGEPGASY